jgi:hypothetical protein
MKFNYEKNKIKFSFKEIFIIVIIALTIVALSYDDGKKGEDNCRFPIEANKN